MKSIPTILALGFFLAAPITTNVFAQASIQLNVVYRCNGERLIVSRCRDDSDSAYCSVSYPDRKGPATGGLTPELAEQRGDLIRKLRACGALTSTASTTPQPAQTVGAFEARVESFLSQSGYEYHKVKTNSWYMLLPGGTNLKQIRILVGAGPNSIALGAVVVSNRSLRITAESMQKMMKLSYDLNYARVCIDTDGDLIIMSQLRDRWLDAEEFKRSVNLVSAAADRAYGEMRPFLTAP